MPSPLIPRLLDAWVWLKAHWYVPLIFLGVLVGFVVSKQARQKGQVLEQTRTELHAGRAAAEAARWKIALGAERAAEKIEAQHQETLAKLDAAERREADALRQSPKDLARFLVRAGARPRGDSPS